MILVITKLGDRNTEQDDGYDPDEVIGSFTGFADQQSAMAWGELFVKAKGGGYKFDVTDSHDFSLCKPDTPIFANYANPVCSWGYSTICSDCLHMAGALNFLEIEPCGS